MQSSAADPPRDQPADSGATDLDRAEATEAPPGFWDSVRGDLHARRGAPPSFGFFLRCLLNRGFLAVFCYRLGQLFRRWPLLPWFCRRTGAFLTHVTIHESAKIGPGLVLPHSLGQVIGRDVEIGNWVYLYQGVVLGPRGQDQGADSAPIIGNHVHLYPHSCVFGHVTVGDYSEVGAHCVVFKDLPTNSVVLPPAPTVLRGMPFAKRSFTAPRQSAGDDANHDPTKKEDR